MDERTLSIPRNTVTCDYDRWRMFTASGIPDDELLMSLQWVGYSAETMCLLEFVPALFVMWSQGPISEERRRLAFLMAERDEIVGTPESRLLLKHLLEARPLDSFFEVSLSGLRALLRVTDNASRHLLESRIAANCVAVTSEDDGRLGPHVTTSAFAMSCIAAALEFRWHWTSRTPGAGAPN